MDKKLNRGFSAIGIVIVLVAVAIIAGGIYFYLNSQMPRTETNTGTPTGENNNNQVSTSSQSASTAANKIDCGTIDITVALNDQTQAAMDCINSSIINCNPDIVKIVGTGVSTLEVLGKDGNDCIIERKTITPAPNSSNGFEYYSVCKFPMDTFISALVQSFKNQGASADLLFMGLSFIKGIDNAQIGSDGWYPNEVVNLIPGKETFYKCK